MYAEQPMALAKRRPPVRRSFSAYASADASAACSQQASAEGSAASSRRSSASGLSIPPLAPHSADAVAGLLKLVREVKAQLRSKEEEMQQQCPKVGGGVLISFPFALLLKPSASGKSSYAYSVTLTKHACDVWCTSLYHPAIPQAAAAAVTQLRKDLSTAHARLETQEVELRCLQQQVD